MLITTVVDGDTAVDAAVIPTAYDVVDEQDIGPSKSWSASASWTVIDFGNIFSLSAANAAKASAHLNVFGLRAGT